MNGKRADPRRVGEAKNFSVSISSKRFPLPHGSGEAEYWAYPEIVEQIIGGASETATDFQEWLIDDGEPDVKEK